MSYTKEEMDPEWINLILIAQNMGVTINEIRAFLRQANPSFATKEGENCEPKGIL